MSNRIRLKKYNKNNKNNILTNKDAVCSIFETHSDFFPVIRKYGCISRYRLYTDDTPTLLSVKNVAFRDRFTSPDE